MGNPPTLVQPATEEEQGNRIETLTRREREAEEKAHREYDYSTGLVAPYTPYTEAEHAAAEEERREIETWEAEEYDRKYYPGAEFVRNHALARARGIWEPELQVENRRRAAVIPDEEDYSSDADNQSGNQESAAKGSKGMGKAPFGSITLSMHHAAFQLNRAVDFVATCAQNRRRVMRPT